MKITFPEIIQIETNLICNAGCTFCPQHEAIRERKIMTDDVWRKIVDESRDRNVIYRPFMVNEPLTDKRMPEIIRYIKEDETALVELNSNGALLTEELGTRLIDAGLDVIRFSVDGFSEESFKKSGRGDDFNTVVGNINNFITLKKKLNSSVFVWVRMIDLDVNKHEQTDYVNYWGERADKAVIVDLYDWPWTGQEKPVMKPCPKIRKEMFFNTDGKAVLCCWDNFTKGVIGDIKDSTVEEIWNSGINRQYREYLNKGRRDLITLCSRCDGFERYDFSHWEGY